MARHLPELEDVHVPRVSSDPAVIHSIDASARGSRRSLLNAFDRLENDAERPPMIRSARAHRSISFVQEDLGKGGRHSQPGLSCSMNALPTVPRFPLQPINPVTPPVAPLPSSPGQDMTRTARRTNRLSLRPSPRSAFRPRSGSHTSEGGSSGSPSPNPSRPVSPSPLSPMHMCSSPRPLEMSCARVPIFTPIINDVTQDGMSDACVVPTPMEDSTLVSDSSSGSVGPDGSHLQRCLSAPVFNKFDQHISLSSSAVETRRKRDSSCHNQRLWQSTSNLPDPPREDIQAEHVQSVLPRVTSSNQPDLWLVSPETVHDLVCGKYASVYESCYIIDCRYPFEYRGGHVRGAINLSSKDQVQDLFMSMEQKKNAVIVFYCEFSSQRGPTSYRHLRECDRNANKAQWPFVWYPQTFVLEGGYKAFYEAYPESCEPHSYVPMLDERYKEDLRQCQMQNTRMRSKSFSCIELPRHAPYEQVLAQSFSQQ